MENASKALIIAGAILLSIAIIGIGMYVYNNAATAMEGTDMTDQQVDTYNQTFTNYGGVQRGANVKTLCDRVASHNRTATDDTEKVQIKELSSGSEPTDVSASSITVQSTSDINTIKNTNIKSGVTYQIQFGYDPASGRVTTVYYTEITQ